MQQVRPVKITGTGMYVPERVVTNFDLEKLMDTTDEWIQQRTGIRERRFAEDNAGPSDLALAACRQALAAADLAPDEIDIIIVATLSPEHYFPGTSAFLQHKLALTTTPALDLRCQCSGFIYGLSVARSLIASGQYKRVLLCGVELQSRGIDLSTRGRDMAVLFGDGAGAVVLEAGDDPERGILSVRLHSQGEFADKLWTEYPSMLASPYLTPEAIASGRVWPKMDGRLVFKHAVRRMPEVIHAALQDFGITAEQVDLFLFHQANLRINEAVLKLLDQPAGKTYNNIDRYGNCSAASIPICLDECVRAGRLNPGDLVCMSSFGSGFTWGAALVRW